MGKFLRQFGFVFALGVLALSGCSNKNAVAAGPAITFQDVIPSAYTYVPYDVGAILYQEEGVSYSLTADYQNYDTMEDIPLSVEGLTFTQNEDFDVHLLVKAIRESDSSSSERSLIIPVEYKDPADVALDEANDLLYGQKVTYTYVSASWEEESEELGPSDPKSKRGVRFRCAATPKDWPDMRLELQTPLQLSKNGVFLLDCKHTLGEVNRIVVKFYDEEGAPLSDEVNFATGDATTPTWKRCSFSSNTDGKAYALGFFLNTYDSKSNTGCEFYFDNMVYKTLASVKEEGTKGQEGYRLSNMENLPSGSASCSIAPEFDDLYSSTSGNALKAKYTSNPYPDLNLVLPEGFLNRGGLFSAHLKFVNAEPTLTWDVGEQDYDPSHRYSPTLTKSSVEGWYDAKLDFSVLSGYLDAPKDLSNLFHLLPKEGEESYVLLDEVSYSIPVKEKSVESGSLGGKDYAIHKMENLALTPIGCALAYDRENVFGTDSLSSLKASYVNNEWPAIALALPTGFKNNGGTITLKAKFVNAEAHCYLMMDEENYNAAKQYPMSIGEADDQGWCALQLDMSSVSGYSLTPKYLTLNLHLYSTPLEDGTVSSVYLDEIAYVANAHPIEQVATNGVAGKEGYQVSRMENLSVAVSGCGEKLSSSLVYGGDSSYALSLFTPRWDGWDFVALTLPEGFTNHGGVLSCHAHFSGANEGVSFMLGTKAYDDAYTMSGTIGAADENGWHLVSVDYSASSNYLEKPTILTISVNFGAVSEGEVVTLDELSFSQGKVQEGVSVSGSAGTSGYTLKNMENLAPITNCLTYGFDEIFVSGTESVHSLKLTYLSNEYPFIDFTLPSGFKLVGGTLSMDLFPTGGAGTPLEAYFGTAPLEGYKLKQAANYASSDAWSHVSIDYSSLVAGTDYLAEPTHLTLVSHIPSGAALYLDNLTYSIA